MSSVSATFSVKLGVLVERTVTVSTVEFATVTCPPPVADVRATKVFVPIPTGLPMVVAEKDAVPRAGQKGRSPISAIQTAMKDFLDLDFQLDDIDYTKKNFVHADMSPDEMAKSMKDRGESIWTILLRMMVRSIFMAVFARM